MGKKCQKTVGGDFLTHTVDGQLLLTSSVTRGENYDYSNFQIYNIHLLSAFRKGVVLRKLQRLGLRGS